MTKKLLLALFALLVISTRAQLVYKDVAGIFINRCGYCHNQYGPFSLLKYTETYIKTPQILTELQNGTMPPWPPDTTYTRFVHERLITTQETNDIISWINSGALSGDTTQAPNAPAYSKYKLNGTPSLTLKIPTYTSNATSTDKYNCFVLNTGLSQDMYLRAFEIVPGNPAIVHHVVVTIDTTASSTSDLSGGCYTQPGQFSIGGYAPGSNPTIFPSGTALKLGMRIKAGSQVVMQIHYPKGSVGLVDSTQIRMYFYPVGTAGIRPLYARTLLQNWNMVIAANTTATYTAQYPSNSSTLPTAWSIYSTFPHSHNICTSLYNWADQGGTNTIPLIRVNKWDFDWQDYYIFPNMVKIPAGYKLRSSHFFDNTTNNPTNPNPATVVAGTSTNNEMLFDAFMYTTYQNGDENIDIGSILDSDSLLNTTAVTAFVPPPVTKVGAYPNPFTDKVNLVYDLKKPSFVTVSVYNVFGQEVGTLASGWQPAGAQRVEWDGKSNGTALAPGLYTYKVMIDNAVYTGKIVLKSRN
jgi:hypothetical protein